MKVLLHNYIHIFNRFFPGGGKCKKSLTNSTGANPTQNPNPNTLPADQKKMLHGFSSFLNSAKSVLSTFCINYNSQIGYAPFLFYAEIIIFKSL
jgi:hypothetical protein